MEVRKKLGKAFIVAVTAFITILWMVNTSNSQEREETQKDGNGAIVRIDRKQRLITYVSNKYDYKISYTSDFSIIIDQLRTSDYYNNSFIPQARTVMSEFQPIAIIFKGYNGNSLNTDAILAAINISISNNIRDFTNCLSIPHDAPSGVIYYNKRYRNIDHRQFVSFDVKLDGEANMTTFFARHFRTKRNNICYDIELSEAGGGFSAVPGTSEEDSQQQAKNAKLPFSAWSAYSELNKIIISFKLR